MKMFNLTLIKHNGDVKVGPSEIPSLHDAQVLARDWIETHDQIVAQGELTDDWDRALAVQVWGDISGKLALTIIGDPIVNSNVEQ